jgi:hypothetical protein
LPHHEKREEKKNKKRGMNEHEVGREQKVKVKMNSAREERKFCATCERNCEE